MTIETGVLYCEDNLAQLGKLPDESIDLIYLDPPFFSNRVYEVIWGDEAEVRSFEDRWEGGIQHYIGWMRERVEELRRVLKSTGSLYLHCDPHASHYLKVMLDQVFGISRFRNEIVWRRAGAHTSPRRFDTLHDIILFYAKSDDLYFRSIRRPYTNDHVRRRYILADDGRLKFNTGGNILTGPGAAAGDSGEAWRGFDPGTRQRHWAIPGYLAEQMPPEFESLTSTQKLESLYQAGLVEIKPGAAWPHPVKFLASDDGVSTSDIWAYQPGTDGVLYGTADGIDADVQWLPPKGPERLGYPTQKPEGLLERIVAASSNPGDIVLDPFCGCGTTIAVAERLGRRWVGIDISPTAIEIMRRRLVRQTGGTCRPTIIGAPTSLEALKALKPFEFQNWVINAIHGTHSPRKVHDMGIDGHWFLTREPVQVKQSEKVGRNVVDNFQTAIRRAGFDAGYVIAFSFTKDAREEVARAKWQEGLTIRLIRVQELLTPSEDRPLSLGPRPESVVDLPIPAVRKAADLPTAEELVASDVAS